MKQDCCIVSNLQSMVLNTSSPVLWVLKQLFRMTWMMKFITKAMYIVAPLPQALFLTVSAHLDTLALAMAQMDVLCSATSAKIETLV